MDRDAAHARLREINEWERKLERKLKKDRPKTKAEKRRGLIINAGVSALVVVASIVIRMRLDLKNLENKH